MGELHLALSGSDDLRKLIVIKHILGHLADEEFVRRFLDEAKVAVKLSHGNLVPVYESGAIDGHYYLAMEFIDGTDLRTFWRQLRASDRVCPLTIALHIAREVCRGLAYAHTFGELHLVHRDVSPPNILISWTGEVRLTDFGLASSTIKMQKTAPGILFGKLSYMAPEQARNEPVDARTDIYALGVVLWELITGKRLFPKAGSQLEQLRRAANPNVQIPSAVNPDIPAAVDLIVMRALALNVNDRYPVAEAMRQDLAAYLAKLDPTLDALTVQRFLEELYGGEIKARQVERQVLLDSMAGEIKSVASQLNVVAPTARTSPSPLSAVSAPQPTDPAETSLDPGEWEEYPLSPTPLASDPSRYQLPSGAMLGGRYRIDHLVREGGMGIVYRAMHIGIDREVAVKILHPHFSSMPTLVSRFQREAKAASRIGHPNIVDIFDSGTTDDGRFFFAMEYLAGQDLADLLAQEGPLPIGRALQIAVQVCQALSAAHDAEIIHRDLKPENVFLVMREGNVDFVKVLDFGIALSPQEGSSYRDRLTNPGVPMGTPEHMAPEQAVGLACDHRADIYGVGVLLYEMLIGRPPHEGDNVLEVLERRASEPVPPLSAARSDVPAELDRIVTWALAINPDERPQSMAQLAYELQKLVRGRAGAVASMLGLEKRPPSSDVVAVPGGLFTSDEIRPPTMVSGALPAIQLPQRSVSHVLRQRAGLLATLLTLAIVAPVAIILIWGRQDNDTPRPPSDAAAAIVAPARTDDPSPTATGPGPLIPPPPPETAALAATPFAPGTPPAATKSPAATKTPATPAAAPTRRPSIALATADAHLRAGRFAEARAAYQQARRVRETRGAALVGLAEVAFQQGDYSQAQRLARAAVTARAGTAAILILGNSHFKLKRYREAVQAYRRVLKREPNHREAARNLAAAEQLLRTTNDGTS